MSLWSSEIPALLRSCSARTSSGSLRSGLLVSPWSELGGQYLKTVGAVLRLQLAEVKALCDVKCWTSEPVKESKAQGSQLLAAF